MSKKIKVLLVYPNLPLMLVPPLAVAIFTRIIKQLGHTVDLFDTTDYLDDSSIINTISPQNRVKFLQARDFLMDSETLSSNKYDLLGDFRLKVERFNPDLILYAAVVEDSFLKCASMVHSIEDLNIKSVIGGVFTTMAPEVALSYPGIKYVAIGEGEKTIVDLIHATIDGKSFSSIKGLAFLKDGLFVKNEPQELVDIEKSTPDYSLFDSARFIRPMGGRMFKSVPVETYRGCPYQCTYCNSPTVRDAVRSDIKNIIKINTENYSSSFLRRKSMSQLKNEINDIARDFDPEFIYFVDDSFLARPKDEIFNFCEMYEEIKIPFWFNTRPENCTLDVLHRLKQVGCYRISFGLEAGNEAFRTNILKRKGNNLKIKSWFDVIKKSEIPFSINLIIGFPGETRDHVFETIELTREIGGFDTITVSIFTPYHGTPLRKMSVENGWLSDDTLTVHTTSSSILKMPPPLLSKHEIDGLMRTAPLYVYFSKEQWPDIEKIERGLDDGTLYKYYSDIYKDKFLGKTQHSGSEESEESRTSGCNADPKSDIFYQ